MYNSVVIYLADRTLSYTEGVAGCVSIWAKQYWGNIFAIRIAMDNGNDVTFYNVAAVFTKTTSLSGYYFQSGSSTVIYSPTELITGVVKALVAAPGVGNIILPRRLHRMWRSGATLSYDQDIMELRMGSTPTGKGNNVAILPTDVNLPYSVSANLDCYLQCYDSAGLIAESRLNKAVYIAPLINPTVGNGNVTFLFEYDIAKGLAN